MRSLNQIDWWPARRLSRHKTGGDEFVCKLQHLPEPEAVSWASYYLDFCNRQRGNSSEVDASCEARRAYIKQRWGY